MAQLIKVERVCGLGAMGAEMLLHWCCGKNPFAIFAAVAKLCQMCIYGATGCVGSLRVGQLGSGGVTVFKRQQAGGIGAR
jgi:hypothetical protein